MAVLVRSAASPCSPTPRGRSRRSHAQPEGGPLWPSAPRVTGELCLALDETLVRENVRELDDAHVDNLTPSIAVRGLLVPLIVQSADAGKQGQSEDRSLAHRR